MQYKIFDKEMKLVINENAFESKVTVSSPAEGVELIQVELNAKSEPAIPEIEIQWETDALDIQGQWHPGSRDTKHLMPPWAPSHRANVVFNAPVFSLYNTAGTNRMTFALSECVYPTEVFCAVKESMNSVFTLAARVKPEDCMQVSNYSVTLRVDKREKHFARVLEDIVAWWESLGYAPRKIPALAREPIYSSWYAFHGELSTEELIREGALASELGCKLMIMDAGWDSNIDDDFSNGDWEPTTIKDIRYLSDRLHELGLKFMVWFAVPFISRESKAWERFAKKVFNPEQQGSIVLDYRYKEIRDHINSILENAVRDWNLEGLKIDFIDSIPVKGPNPNPNDPERDTESVCMSIIKFFEELMGRLEKINKDTLIEF
ncbi:MAG TPA: alpha-galactosidase, partial [Clostridia bacterium]|nr:alpha-galactosidase [Clostridia bacterium]